MVNSKIQLRQASSDEPLGEFSKTLSSIFRSRGLSKTSDLDYGLNKLLPPQGLSNISDAAHLLSEAVLAQANIVIVGDFDADGATSCALAVKCLKSFGLENVSYLVPNRFEYGYGLSPEIVGMAAMRQPDIIITVDNGISSIDGVHAAQALGITVLITDHHLPGESLPTADVIVNPNLAGDRFSSKNLAGVGVIFYVMLALRSKLRSMNWFSDSSISEPNMSQFLDLVALGTVADVVPLDTNNRILVQQGLKRIRDGKACFGIQALLKVGNRSTERLKSSDLGFVVGPRLNAAGRLDDMSVGIECLLCENESQAITIAVKLDELNRERRSVEQTMQDDAIAVVEKIALSEQDQPPIYILSDESWHQGIVGLVASRIKERTNRPVIALAPGDNEGEWKGSCRSIEGIHIRDLLARVDTLCPGLLTKFGGHAMAAGFSIQDQKLSHFEIATNNVADQMTQGIDWDQVILSDGALAGDEFSLAFAEQLSQLTPWGQAFPEPIFDGEFEIVDARIVGEKHVKFKLSPVLSELNKTLEVDAIFFNCVTNNSELPSGIIRAAYKLDINEFRDKLSLQLIIQHIE